MNTTRTGLIVIFFTLCVSMGFLPIQWFLVVVTASALSWCLVMKGSTHG